MILTTDKIYCSKSIHRQLDVTCFKREIDVLRDSSHPNIVHLEYIVIIYGKIEAILLEYVHNARVMVDIEEISMAQFDQWTNKL